MRSTTPRRRRSRSRRQPEALNRRFSREHRRWAKQSTNRSAHLVQQPSHGRRKPCAEFFFGYWGSRSRSSSCFTSSTSFSGYRHAVRIARIQERSAARRPVRSAESSCGGTPAVQRAAPTRAPAPPDGIVPGRGAVPASGRKCRGEPVGIRTRDLLIKSQLLYQLSYGLHGGGNIGRTPHRVNARRLLPELRYKSSSV